MKLFEIYFKMLKSRFFTNLASLVVLYIAMLETMYLVNYGEYRQMVQQLVVWAFVKVTFCCLLDFITDVLLAMALPSVDGYCYTALFNWHYRLNAYKEYGRNPELNTLSFNVLVDRKARFSYQMFGRDRLHIWRDAEGCPAEQLFSLGKGLRVGTEEIRITPVWIYQFVQQSLRLATWVAAVGYFQTYSLAMIPFIWLCYRHQLDNIAPVIPLFGFFLWNKNFIAGIVISVLMSVATYFSHIIMVKHVRRSCELENQSAPVTEWYPPGVNPRGLTGDFDSFRSLSPIYEKMDYTDDSYLPSDDRAILMQEAGLTKVDTKASGNPHRLAALVGRFFKWRAAREAGWTDIGYKIIIGGTFKGHACSESGLAVQPFLDEGDAHNFLNYPSRPGYGQMVINGTVGTSTEPVGSTGETFDPQWDVRNLGGADVWMTHVYDIPIKALLAIADANDSKTVNVVMHATPSLFEDLSGELPYTGQEFVVDGPNYKFKWKTTSGKTYTHNRRIYYEHFFTSYVCTSAGVWYVSEIPRQVMDVYLIRWTRQDVEPVFEEERQLVIRPRKDATYVPAGSYDPTTGMFSFRRVSTQKQIEEYIHRSKNVVDLSTNCRALTDNLFRNKGIDCPHFSPETVLDIHTAEENRRALVDLTLKPKYCGLLEYCGLKPDPKLTSSLARSVLSCLVKQPPTRVVKPMLRQVEPFTVVTTRPNLAGPRYYPLHNLSDNMALVSQGDLDVKCPTGVIKLAGQGQDMCERLCHCLFGSTKGPGPILPLGSRSKGGSELVKNGNQLLETEVEHLTTFNNVVFVAKFNSYGGEEKVEYCGHVANGERQLVVYINCVDGTVSLVHRPIGLDTPRLMAILGATATIFDPAKPWFVALAGTDRDYKLHWEATRLVIAKTNERVAKDATNNFSLLPGSWKIEYAEDGVCKSNSKFTIVHDVVRLTDDRYIVGHLYSGKGVEFMRELYSRRGYE